MGAKKIKYSVVVLGGVLLAAAYSGCAQNFPSHRAALAKLSA